MEESKTIKKISKVNVPITILQALCMVLTIGVLYHYGFSPAAKAVETTYSSIHDVQISDVEVALETERYREYDYKEAQLDVIRQDIKNGIDVSKYAQKGQSIDEFISARESVIESYPGKTYKQVGLSKLKLISHNNNWQYIRMSTV